MARTFKLPCTSEARYKLNMKQALNPKSGPKPIGPYNQAIKVGDFLFCSGQIPINPNTGQLVEGDIQVQTTQVIENIKSILQSAGLNLENVVKTTVYMTDLTEFPAMNEVYAKYFGPVYPARTTVQVDDLPRGAKIEIDVIAHFSSTPSVSNLTSPTVKS